MKFTKPSPGLVEEFKAAIGLIRDAQPRRMFGYDCVFVNGNFAAGLWRNTAVFKLSAEDGARITAEAGAIPFAPMKGRPMKGWYEAPEAVSHDAEQLAEWCARAAAFARSLPPKSPKVAKARGKSPAPPRKRSAARTSSKKRGR